MTPAPCTCGACRECDIRAAAAGLLRTAPAAADGSAARDYAAIVAACDGHAKPARPRRRAPADATPGLFDATPEPEDSRRDL